MRWGSDESDQWVVCYLLTWRAGSAGSHASWSMLAAAGGCLECRGSKQRWELPGGSAGRPWGITTRGTRGGLVGAAAGLPGCAASAIQQAVLSIGCTMGA